MANIETEGLPLAAPTADPWPFDGLGDDNPLSLQADETLARQLDTGFAIEVRRLVHDPSTGLAGRDPEGALAGIAETIPLLGELKDRLLAQATGPRQKALLEPLIDRRLDRADGVLGRIAQQATSVLDDRSVADRLADLKQDASLSWQDPAHLRLLGRTAVDELRYQGERKGWDAGRTDTAVRTGLSDLYAGAVEAAISQDPERAATLYDHARDVIQPERQAAVERRIERAREERRVTEIVGGLADMPDDPTRRPDPDDYQARAAEATPPDASPEVRAQVSRMARIEQARADRAWQAARGRAATSALDWLGANPAAPLMAMPVELRDGLSPEQSEAFDRTAMNGGRVVTDRELYDRLDDQAVHEPGEFTSLDLTQYRLSLGDSDYDRLTKLQKTLAEGKPDPAFERHRLGRLFLEEGLRNANVDPNGAEARPARQQLDRLVGAFEAVEGRPPTMADIRSLVGHVVSGVLPRANGDPNIVRIADEPAEANGNTQIGPLEESVETDGNTQIAPPQEPEVKDAFDGAEPHVVHNDDGSAEVTAGNVATPGGPAEATIRIDRGRSGASAEMVLPNGRRVESRRTSPDGRTWSQIDTIRDPQGAVVGTQTTTFDGTRVTQTWEPANGPAQTASWEAEPPPGGVHLANGGVAALRGLGTAGSLAADALTATAKAIAGDMLALGTRALGLAGSAVAWVAAGAGVLLTPTNSQGTTVDLGDGVRLRQPPGDSSGVIEKSALGGSLWDRTPVAVHIQEGATSDRRQILTIDATALEWAIGPEAADRVLAEAARRFDVVPIYSSRPPVEKDGIGHNRGPALNDPTAVNSNGQPPGTPGFKGFLLAVAAWVAQRKVRVDKDQYTASDGIDTAIGVRLDPRVGEPAAGRDYLPDNESHRKGLRGEYGLANDIVRHFPDHTVVNFGRKAGEGGADVISVDRNGEVTFWDSKWRGSDTSISPGRRAHQTENSFENAREDAICNIRAAMRSGRLSPEAGAKALENMENRNLTIVTVGTGSARNGVIEQFLGGKRAIVHP